MGNFFSYVENKMNLITPSETLSIIILSLTIITLIYELLLGLCDVKAGIIYIIIIIGYMTLFYLLREQFKLYNRNDQVYNIIYFSFSLVLFISLFFFP